MRVRGYAWLVAALCLVLLTTGCSGATDKPSTLPSVTSASSEPSAPTNTAQPNPGQRIVAYYKAVDHAGSTGQGLGVPALFYSSSCSVCVQIDRRIREIVARGQHAVQGGHVVEIRGAVAKGQRGFTVTASLRTVPGALVDHSGKTVEHFAATGPYQWVYELQPGSGNELRIVSATNLGLPG